MNTNPNPTPPPDKLAETPTRPISRDYKGDGSTRDYIEDLNAYADAKERELAAVVAERDGNGKRATRAEKKWDELLGRLDVAQSALTQLRAENEKLRQQKEAFRWNIEPMEDGGIRVCRGLHDKGQPCEDAVYVPLADLTHLKAELERANELLGNVLGEGRVGHAIWNDIAAHLNPKKTP